MASVIHIKYENERGIPCPEYIKLPEEARVSHPRLWTVTIDNPTDLLSRWLTGLPSKLAAPEVA